MIRVFLLIALLLAASVAVAEEPGGKGNGPSKEIEYKIKSNRALLQAARKILEESDDKQGLPLLKMAEAAGTEGEAHYRVGEYDFAAEDLSQSTQMAIHAIILTKNSQDATIRDVVIREEVLLREKHDRERKEKLLRKGIKEVETFIRTADRLLARHSDEKAAGELNRTREVFERSKEKLSAGRLDESLEELNKAYKMATRTVKEIKKSQGEVLTFPKPAFTDEKEEFAFEVKKNESYFFFAAQVSKSAQSQSLINSAEGKRSEAIRMMEAGDVKKATETMRVSTESLIRAIKESD